MINFNKPFRASLKLKKGKSPHLYVSQIKAIMKDDTSMHPMMKKTLKMLKKTRTPYIMLSTIKEVVIDPMNHRHFDRSVNPKGNWVCTLWSEDEIIQYKKDKEAHIKAIFKLFENLGYEFYDSKVISEEYMKMLEDLTVKQIDNQLKQREK